MKLTNMMFLLLAVLVQSTVSFVASFSTPFTISTPRLRTTSLAVSVKNYRMEEMDLLPTNKSFIIKTLLLDSSSKAQKEKKESERDDSHNDKEKNKKHHEIATAVTAAGVAVVGLAGMPQPAVAISNNFALESSLAAYAHIFSILAITGCLVAERLLIQTDMTKQEEDMVNQIDLVYGLLAALLIGSGFARAVQYGKGGDFYIHEVMFWIKMTLSGVWGGLSIFPTMIFRQRKEQQQQQQQEQAAAPPSLSQPLVNRLHSIINAEISAIWTIPLLASLMSHGVGYSPDLPWEAGALISISATIGSFAYYGTQAMTWSDEKDDKAQKEKDMDSRNSNNDRLAMGQN